MPEGDTIRKAADALRPLVGDRLDVMAVHPRARATGAAERLDGRVLERVEAHGKNLFLHFQGPVVLRSHLGMSGSWRVTGVDDRVAGSPWLVLRGRRHQAVLHGGARLDVLRHVPTGLGPDVLGGRDDLLAARRNLRAAPALPIGEALLDQRRVSGIGNIWRAEALWAARVSPWQLVGRLEEQDLDAVLAEAARLMALSVDGRTPGRSVYRRAGRPCRRCGTAIASRKQGDHARTTYWCPGCQGERGDEARGA